MSKANYKEVEMQRQCAARLLHQKIQQPIKNAQVYSRTDLYPIYNIYLLVQGQQRPTVGLVPRSRAQPVKTFIHLNLLHCSSFIQLFPLSCIICYNYRCHCSTMLIQQQMYKYFKAQNPDVIQRILSATNMNKVSNKKINSRNQNKKDTAVAPAFSKLRP